jgi:SAM-dependent methyltransferase
VEQTPAHELHNPELLELMPPNAPRIVEVGCSTGAMAREYKRRNPNCRYIGIEIVPRYAELARRYCDSVHELDIEGVTEAGIRESMMGDCWVFGDALEHLKDPWELLGKIRRALPSSGCVVACIPNAQHWSLQARLNSGDWAYEESGLLDKTHLRWFTRQTIIEMFERTGFRIEAGLTRTFGHPQRDRVLAGIRSMAQATGSDPERAVADALPFQYVLRAIPA